MQKSLLIPLIIFVVAFLYIPVAQLNALQFMPGDVGDARLNNYFLEHVFRYLSAEGASLWHLPFFSPFPYTIGFSENLFGSFPIYFIARVIGLSPETSYQFWFLCGYAVNFSAAFYALRMLGRGLLAASIGALIFAFALPTTAHAGHAQLHFRFGLPLAIAFLTLFFQTQSWRAFAIAAGWLAWQFYASVYMGFFTLLLLCLMAFTYVAQRVVAEKSYVKLVLKEFAQAWSTQGRRESGRIVASLFVCVAMLALLFYPYLKVSLLYGATRSWAEIASMLPRPQSYLLADASFLWSSGGAKVFAGLPMRHEHQMFMGLVPLALCVIGLVLGNRKINGVGFTLISGSLLGTFALTLCIGGFSLWYFLHHFPLVSAIRAVTRVDQALLFPVGYFAAISVDWAVNRFASAWKVIGLLLLPITIFEAGATSMGVSPKEVWRQRLAALEPIVPQTLGAGNTLFLAQRSGPPYADELDAMWISLRRGVATMNGYSGFYPPNHSYSYGNDCSEIPRRILSYLSFSDIKQNTPLYRDLMSRVVPVGFVNCDKEWWQSPPSLSRASRAYSADEIRKLSFHSAEMFHKDGQRYVRVSLRNSATTYFSAQSAIGKPIRISWRFLDSSGKPLSDWTTRKDLPFDIPANDSLSISIKLDAASVSISSSVQISLVQEGAFWAHDVGVSPMTVAVR